MTENGAEIKKTILKVDGVFIPDPSEMQWGFQSVSDSNAGRDINGKMHVNLVTRKRKLELKWSGIDFAATKEVLQAVLPETFVVEFHDFLTNGTYTGTFYVGDRTSMVKSFVQGYRRCDVAFNIIEV